MIHRVSSGTGGTRGSVHVQEMEMEDNIRHLQEAKELNKRLTEIYVEHNSKGNDYNKFFETMKYDTFLRAEQAVEWGLADMVIKERPA